ncbi:LLM class F420-dependent oxidoreductase [Amycolatopsis sp. CA-230715]|uniref:LLM class F420-dependent oxidoreductase n=1 Tax=Amycolatopsis sp. CA-230715 TaxID=2745196 RepID=UPI001C01AB2A|nr:LLM class F420-dependent oxidoreductase [Amycolatopsis sp. CA-230715]
MELGVHVIKFDHPGGPAAIAPELARVGAAVENAGVRWLSVVDHYFQMEHHGDASDAMIEGYSALSFLAAHTTTTRLGMLVTGVTYRYPGLLAKIVTTLDVLSGGRATLGLGAGWYEREHKGLGVPFPSTAERFERLEETLQVCLQMWDPGNSGAYEGKHYRLAETICVPPPISAPRPPILVGGGGEKKTLRLVARYADACNLLSSTPEEVAHKLDVLRRHCDDAGRDYAEIEKTGVYNGEALRHGDLDGVAAELAPFAKLGITKVIVMPPDQNAAAWIDERCAPLVPKLAEL